jgi:PilZ domain
MPERRTDKRSSNTDRRESPRLIERFLIRESGDDEGDWERHEGNLSLGGFAFTGTHPTYSNAVDVRFRLKGVAQEIRARGEVIRVKTEGKQVEFHVRFTQLSEGDEMDIAKFIDDRLIEER